jgi:hypothetical protein
MYPVLCLIDSTNPALKFVTVILSRAEDDSSVSVEMRR